MVVIGAHTQFGVRRQTTSVDGYGSRRAEGRAPLGQAFPGRVVYET